MPFAFLQPAWQPFASGPLSGALVIGAIWVGMCGCDRAPPPQRFEVASSSMAPTLLGPSQTATCSHCGHSFPVAAETVRPSLPTRCSQCGGECRVDPELIAGTQVQLEPIAVTQPPQRFELIAFTDSTSGLPHVKRVWGLPEEQVILRGGEVYLSTAGDPSPRFLQKSLDQLKQLCIPVANFPSDIISHWCVVSRDGAGIETCQPLQVLKPTTADIQPVQLVADTILQWRHQRPAPVHPDEVPSDQWLMPSPLMDDYTVNQGVSCQLHVVDDYLFSLKLHTPVHGKLIVSCRCGTSLATVELDFGPAELDTTQLKTARRIDIAWCDQRLLVQTDLKSLVVEGEQLQNLISATFHESRINEGVLIQLKCSVPIQLTELVVARDHYFDDWEASSTTTSGYFVLGDNLPVSIDSRSGLRRIQLEQIVGRVVRRR